MPVFEYQAIDLKGGGKKGIIEADSERHARQLLRDKKLLPNVLKQIKKKEGKRSFSPFAAKLSTREKVAITRQLANLIRAALPVEEALRTIAEHNNSNIRRFLSTTRSRVVEGMSLSQALQEQGVFEKEYTATIAAGETSGELTTVLEKLANDVERREKFNRSITSAMIYPAVLLVVALSVIIALLTFVVPEVVDAFVSTQRELPQLTKGMIIVSTFLQDHGFTMALVLLGMLLVFNLALRKISFKRSWHRFLMKTPLVGKVFIANNNAQFARNFSLMQSSGVTVLDALRSTAQIISCLPMQEAILKSTEEIREGSSIFRALEKHKALPPMTLYMLASGEASGNLADMLERAAVAQENELEDFTSSLLSIIAPIIVLIMGGFVLLIVLSILLPIFELNSIT